MLYTTPKNITVPGFDEIFYLEVEQQPGLFFDDQMFELIGKLQMYHNTVPWQNAAGGVAEGSCKCISPINNVLASLFKSITVTVNNQYVIGFEYSSHAYMHTLLTAQSPAYKNGDFIDQGFYKETAGHLA